MRGFLFICFLLPITLFAQDLLERGITRFHDSNYAMAIQDFEKLIKADSKNADAHYWAGRVKVAQGDKQTAMVYFTYAIDLNTEYVKAYKERGKLKARLKDFKGSIADFDKALNLDSKYVDAYFDRGLSKYYQKDFEGAKRDFTSVIELDPQDHEAYYTRGNANYKSGMKDAACDDWGKAGELGYFIAYDLIKQHCNN